MYKQLSFLNSTALPLPSQHHLSWLDCENTKPAFTARSLTSCTELSEAIKTPGNHDPITKEKVKPGQGANPSVSPRPCWAGRWVTAVYMFTPRPSTMRWSVGINREKPAWGEERKQSEYPGPFLPQGGRAELLSASN